MNKAEKARKLMDLRGITTYFQRQLDEMHYPVIGSDMEFLPITKGEEEKLFEKMALSDSEKFEEAELDDAIRFYESAAGKKIFNPDYADARQEILNAFVKVKLAEYQKNRAVKRANAPILYVPGTRTIN